MGSTIEEEMKRDLLTIMRSKKIFKTTHEEHQGNMKISMAEKKMRLNCLSIIRAKEKYETDYEDKIEASTMTITSYMTVINRQ